MNLGASLQIHSNMHSVCPHLFVSQYTEITYITHTKLHKSDIGSGPSSLSACQLLFTRDGFLPGGWGAGMPVPCSQPACQPASQPACQPASQPASQPAKLTVKSNWLLPSEVIFRQGVFLLWSAAWASQAYLSSPSCAPAP